MLERGDSNPRQWKRTMVISDCHPMIFLWVAQSEYPELSRRRPFPNHKNRNGFGLQPRAPDRVGLHFHRCAMDRAFKRVATADCHPSCPSPKVKAHRGGCSRMSEPWRTCCRPARSLGLRVVRGALPPASEARSKFRLKILDDTASPRKNTPLCRYHTG